MKAITLHQPFASLIAEGVKTIETRGRRAPWSSAVGETIAIHAGAHWPDKHHYFPPLCPTGCWRDEENCPGHIMECPTITDPAHHRAHVTGNGPRGGKLDPVPKAAQTPTLFWPQHGRWARPAKENGYGQSSYAPLGAVVAVCTLVDVVPMVDDGTARNCIDMRPGSPKLALRRDDGPFGREIITDVTEQRPFGDYAAGRWALLLDNVQKVAPFPCRGRQGLWTVPPEIADNLLGWSA